MAILQHIWVPKWILLVSLVVLCVSSSTLKKGDALSDKRQRILQELSAIDLKLSKVQKHTDGHAKPSPFGESPSMQPDEENDPSGHSIGVGSPSPHPTEEACDTITDCGAVSLADTRGNLSVDSSVDQKRAYWSVKCKDVGCGGYKPGNACQCTFNCDLYGNCCSDYDAVCIPRPGSVKCKDVGCGSYKPGNACQCTSSCETYGNCCSDYDAVCRPRPGSVKCKDVGCGSYKPGNNCQCTSSCSTYGNCCSDYDAVCRPRPGSVKCKDVGCGSYKPENDCQCTSSCSTYGNCCSDYDAVCRSGPGSVKCKNVGCGSYKPGNNCQCTSSCSTYGNCCSDYDAVCRPGPSSVKCRDVGCGSYKPENDCQCTSSCDTHRNCCSDYDAVCRPGPGCTGDRKKCWDAIRRAMDEVKRNPSAYGDLTADSRPEDFQVYFYNGGSNGCPKPCSWKPPQKPRIPQDDSGKPGCAKRRAFPPPPANGPLQYNGHSWPDLCYVGGGEEHVFIYGDWGGILPGPKPAPNTGNKRSVVHGVDDKAQELIATQMNRRAATSKPRYVLNGGDNFYWGGVAETCGTKSVHQALDDFNRPFLHNTKQFTQVFEELFSGPGMDGIPWFLCFGNHDYGGFHFHAAWDHQIYYTWSERSRWILPAQYWHQHVRYPTKGFSVDYYMLDTNVQDVESNPHVDASHNICSYEHNNGRPSCKKVGGPSDPYDCNNWFKRLYEDQLEWLEQKLKLSTADWQILVTHFPPEPWWRPNGVVPSKQMVNDFKRLGDTYGIDFYVGSHRHSQEMHPKGDHAGIPYVVVGGGGGVTSEHTPGTFSDSAASQYGFMDMTISKHNISIVNINYDGSERQRMEVSPRKPMRDISCKDSGYDCKKFNPANPCQCNDGCEKYSNCCPDYKTVCGANEDSGGNKASCRAPGYGCGTYNPRNPCQCNNDCQKYSNCCPDYKTVCW